MASHRTIVGWATVESCKVPASGLSYLSPVHNIPTRADKRAWMNRDMSKDGKPIHSRVVTSSRITRWWTSPPPSGVPADNEATTESKRGRKGALIDEPGSSGCTSEGTSMNLGVPESRCWLKSAP